MAPLGRLVFPFTDTEMRLRYTIQTEFGGVGELGDWLHAQLTARLHCFGVLHSLIGGEVRANVRGVYSM